MRYITMVNELESLADKYNSPYKDVLGLWNLSTSKLMDQYNNKKLFIPDKDNPHDYCREQSLNIIKRYYSLKQERES